MYMYIYYTRIYILHNFFVHSSVDEHLCYFLVLGTVNSWRRKWQLTPVFLPGDAHGQRSLAGHGPWGRRESDTTEVAEQAL